MHVENWFETTYIVNGWGQRNNNGGKVATLHLDWWNDVKSSLVNWNSGNFLHWIIDWNQLDPGAVLLGNLFHAVIWCGGGGPFAAMLFSIPPDPPQVHVWGSNGHPAGLKGVCQLSPPCPELWWRWAGRLQQLCPTSLIVRSCACLHVC